MTNIITTLLGSIIISVVAGVNMDLGLAHTGALCGGLYLLCVGDK